MKIYQSNGNLEVVQQNIKEIFIILEKLKESSGMDIPIPNHKLVDALFALVNRDFDSDKIDPLLYIVLQKVEEAVEGNEDLKDKKNQALKLIWHHMPKIKFLISNFMKLNSIGKSVKQSLSLLSKSKNPVDVKNMSTEELFEYVDSNGDGNGSVGIEEFRMLSKKLGHPLTEHRVREIFSKIKQHTGDPSSTELDYDEFLEAFQYLEDRVLYRTMFMLGISEAQIKSIIIFFTLYLLMILVFIFLGISAFTVGGGFSTVLNSLIPVGAGTTVTENSKKDMDPKELFKPELMSKTIKDAFKIISAK